MFRLNFTLLVGSLFALVLVQTPSVQAQQYSEFSAAVNLGPAINSPATDNQPALSPNGLSLYFSSTRTGGLGSADLYVSQRSSIDAPWGTPVNLGATVNSTSSEGNPAFSRDGHFMFFQSDRPGGFGAIDIWFSRREDTHDDFAWQPPLNLGAGVNSSAPDTGPSYFVDDGGGAQLYFGSDRMGGPGATDIYVSEQMAGGSFGSAVLVAELSSPAVETRLSIRRDGLEIFLHSNRVGSTVNAMGAPTLDLWVATRTSTLDAWSTPVNLGATTNSAFGEQHPYLSPDMRTLVFSSDRPGGFGGADLYMSTRPVWSNTGNLNSGRDGHSATLLPSGKVLVVGGSSGNTSELYDPATGLWSHTGNLNSGHSLHTATLLPNGKVLVAAGFSNSAELYDPTTGTWSSTGNLHTGRLWHTATLLPNGKVLVVGGYFMGLPLGSAELYDPATGIWTNTGNLITARAQHSATLLPSGKVLIAGGGYGDCFSGLGLCPQSLSSAELYDPDTGIWTTTGNLNSARAYHAASLLPDGRVLVAGGYCISGASNCSAVNSAELYNPANGTWGVTGSPNAGVVYLRATLLHTGKVLIVGDNTTTSQLYDPASGTWVHTAKLNQARSYPTATLLPNGKVLITGGLDALNSALNSAELYEPAPNVIDAAQFFVPQHYADFLNRTPDSTGLGFWTNNITSCGVDTHCLEVKRIDTSAAFFLSIEFQQTGYLVYRIYKSSYGDNPGTPVPVKFSEFLPDTQAIGQGVIVNQAGWEGVLENNKQAFMAAFVQRARFSSAFPTSLTPTQFVDTLFANAGVSPSASDRTATINEFGSATTTGDTAARARALRRVAENSTLAQQEFNKAFVLMQYFGYLRRNPNDPPEAGLNFDGYNFWLTKLNQFNGNYAAAEMVKAFLVSTEYRQRFGQP